MLAYRQNIVVEDPQNIVLHDLPLQAGQAIEIVVLVNDNVETISSAKTTSESEQKRRAEIDKLLEESCGCLGKNKTLEEVDAEIAAMRQEWVREWE